MSVEEKIIYAVLGFMMLICAVGAGVSVYAFFKYGGMDPQDVPAWVWFILH